LLLIVKKQLIWLEMKTLSFVHAWALNLANPIYKNANFPSNALSRWRVFYIKAFDGYFKHKYFF